MKIKLTMEDVRNMYTDYKARRLRNRLLMKQLGGLTDDTLLDRVYPGSK